MNENPGGRRHGPPCPSLPTLMATFNFLRIASIVLNLWSKYYYANSLITCLHVHKRRVFLEVKLLSSQSEQFKKPSNTPDWLEISRPSKTAILFLDM